MNFIIFVEFLLCFRILTNYELSNHFRQKDEGKTISILKLDVEGYEFQIIPHLLQSPILQQIRQIIVEIHSDDRNERNPEDMISMLNSINSLKTKGFQVISYDPNLTMGQLFSDDHYYPNFDLSLLKNV